MKKLKRLLLLVLCLVLVEVPVIAAGTTESVMAATVKEGLKKEKGKYYFYVDGAKVKNTWKRVTKKEGSSTVTNYYYFGKNGAAYAAEDAYGSTRNIVVKKINGKYYGFNKFGKRVSGATAVANPTKLYFFNKNGTYNADKTAQLRKAAKVVRGKEISAAALRKLLGKPLKTKKGNSCYFDNGTDITLTYENLIVTLATKAGNKKEFVIGVYAR